MDGDQELTRRERQVLLLVCDGGTSGQIAHGMGLSAETIDQHIAHIRDRLNVRNRTELVALALRDGMVESDDGVRPACVEVTWSDAGEVEEFLFRYVPAEANRRMPATARGYLDHPLSPFIGPDWQDQAGGLLDAFTRARESDEPQAYEDVPGPNLDTGESHLWSGEIQRVNDTHYLMVSRNFPGG